MDRFYKIDPCHPNRLNLSNLSNPIDGINQPLAKAFTAGNQANDISNWNGKQEQKKNIHPNLKPLLTPYPDCEINSETYKQNQECEDG